MRKLILAVVVLSAFILRVVAIDKYPIGFTQDEAAIGYDAYSLLTTGRDMWGNSWPLILRSFGDFKLPLYSYLAIPSIAVFGLSEFAVRLPGAIMGTLAVLATYLMAVKLTGRFSVALLAAVFLAISPWHLPLSRGAFEANLTTLFIPLGVWAFYKGLEYPKFMTIAALSFGLNLFTYHSARYFTLAFVLILFAFSYKRIKERLGGVEPGLIFKKYPAGVTISLFFIAVLVFSMLSGAQSRAMDIAITNPTDNWAAVADRRYEAVLQNFPDNLARIFSNKATYTVNIFASNYLNYLSPTYLFVQGPSELSYGMIPGRGVLYFVEALFLLSALYAIVKYKKYNILYLLLIWIILAPIPAALTKGPGFAGTRSATMMPALQVLSAFGLVFIYDKIKRIKRGAFSKVFVVGAFLVVVSHFAFFLQEYVYHAPLRAAGPMQYGIKETIAKLEEIENNYDRVIISRSLSVPHIWFAFYKQMDPNVLQNSSREWLRYEKEGFVSVDQLSTYRLGNYILSGIYLLDDFDVDAGTLFVGRKDEVIVEGRLLYTTSHPDGTPAYYIYER